MSPAEEAEVRARLGRVRDLIAAGGLSESEGRLALQRLSVLANRLADVGYRPYPWQVPPDRIETLGTWLLFGGRGTGKTEAGARYVNDHVNGPPCDPRLPGGHRVAIVAPTLGDAVDACVTGPSGIATINRSAAFLTGGVSGSRVVWPSGATARLFGAYTPEDVNRLRAGGNRCLTWMEESAAMRFLDEALEHTALGLRLGRNPHYVMTTTPRARKAIRALIADEHTIVTRGRTAEAFHLDPAVRASYEKRWSGTRLGRQELDAELLDDVEGALWSHDLIDGGRLQPEDAPVCHRRVVAVDPPGSHKPGGAEAGIAVVGSILGEAFLLADLSGRLSPDQWARRAVEAFREHACEAIAVETAYGGDMVVSTIRSIDSTIPVVRVPTKVGKRLRAEPVQALYEQGRVHHVGLFPELEDQMTSWVPDGGGPSPDRIDALVHGVTYLVVSASMAGVANPARGLRRVLRRH